MVQDTVGNVAQVVRTVNIVDTTKPVITLNGDNPATVFVGRTYADAGATATDNYDASVASNVIASGLPIDTRTPGTYTVRYNVADASGNVADEATRTVQVVVPETPPTDVNADGKFDAMDVQLVINGALRLAVPYETDVDSDGKTDAMDVQLVINAALRVF